jgi:PTH1 family peptidyl-tRNA hydrolase
MNESGEAVLRLRDEFSLQPSDMILLHDDLDLSFGRLRVRRGGGGGGHRGVASVLSALGDPDFFRIRIGIGRPQAGEDPVDFVLSRFSPEERVVLPSILQRSADAAWCLISEGAEVAMNRFNRKSPEKDPGES